MRWTARLTAVALASAFVLAASAHGGKPPKPGNADPELTFIEGSKIQIANRDGSNKITVYSNRKSSFSSPKISPDHRSVVFREGYAAIRRTEFSIVSGNVVVGETETLFEGDPDTGDFALYPLQPDGTRLALLHGTDIYELRRATDCPGRACVLADLGEPLYRSEGCLYGRLGGYTANGRALYFQEALDVETCLPVDLMRLEFALEPGSLPNVQRLYAGLPDRSRELDPSPIDYSSAPFSHGPFETRLLFNVVLDEPYTAELWTLDTWSGSVGPLLDADFVPIVGHFASWAPDEGAVIFVRRWQNASNWVQGRVLTFDLNSPIETQIDDFSADPDWAPPLH